MKAVSVRLTLAMIVWGGLATGLAAEQSLGIITADGSFRVDDAAVTGNATLTEGVLIETTASSPSLRFDSGARVTLGENARARVYGDRVVLEAGASEVRSAGGFAVESNSYRIVPESADAAGYVRRADEATVEVASTQGTLRVFDGRGILLANVVAGGDALAFSLQAGGAAPPSSFIGCLVRKGETFILYDQTTRITVELRGDAQQLRQEWGNRVQVIGTTDTTATSEAAAQLVSVSTLTRIGTGGCEPVAQAVGGTLPAGAPTAPGPPPRTIPSGGGGMSAGTKIAIVGGIAAGAGAGAYFGLKKNDRSN